MDAARQLHLIDAIAPLGVALLFVLSMSRVAEPARRHFNAIFVAGAGAAYLGGGLGWWEFVFTAIGTAVAYRGLVSYPAIGVAWMLHVGWDVAHHLHGEPIVWCVPTSSAQCAICDTVIAAWFFAGAPSIGLSGPGKRGGRPAGS